MGNEILDPNANVERSGPPQATPAAGRHIKNPIAVVPILIYFVPALFLGAAFYESDFRLRIGLFIFAAIFLAGTTATFFWLQARKHPTLFSPQEFPDGQTYLAALQVATREIKQNIDKIEQKQVETQEKQDTILRAMKRIEIIQQMQSRPDDQGKVLANVCRMADKFMAQDQWDNLIAALAISRAFLMVRNYDLALSVLDHLEEVVDKNDPEFYQIWANQAYCHIDTGKDLEAIELLERVRAFDGGGKFDYWHAAALAVAYFHKEGRIKTDKYWEMINFVLNHPGYSEDDAEWFRQLYPEIEEDF